MENIEISKIGSHNANKIHRFDHFGKKYQHTQQIPYEGLIKYETSNAQNAVFSSKTIPL